MANNKVVRAGKAGAAVNPGALTVVKATDESRAAMQAEAKGKAAFSRDVTAFIAPVGTGADPFRGKKFKKLSLPPILKWSDHPIGTEVLVRIVEVVESPNKDLSEPLLRCAAPNDPDQEVLVPIGGGFMKPLGIKRGGGTEHKSTLESARARLDPKKGKLLWMKLTDFIPNEKKEDRPLEVPIFDIKIEE